MKKKIIFLIVTLALLNITVVSFAEVVSVNDVDFGLENKKTNEKVVELNEKIDDINKTIEELTVLISEYEGLKEHIELKETTYREALTDARSGYDSTITGVTSIINAASIYFGVFFVIGGIVIPIWRKLSDDKQQKKIIEKQESIQIDFNNKFLEIEEQVASNNKEFNEQYIKMVSIEEKISLIESNTKELSQKTKESSDDAKISSLISESYNYQEKDEFEKALEVLENGKVVENSKERLDYEIGVLYYNWGTHLSSKANKTKNEGLYRESFEKYEESLTLNPNYENTYNNYGIALYTLAGIIEDEILFEESFDKFERLININEKHENVFNGYGIALSMLAGIKGSEKLYEESFDKYKQAIIRKPNDANVYNNYGLALSRLAEMKKDEKLYRESFRNFEKAISVNLNNDKVYNNYGVALSQLGEMKNNETLFYEGFDNFEKAIIQKPNDASVYNNYGFALSILSKINKDDRLTQKSLKQYEKAYSLSGACYNLACLYALNNNEDDALRYLKEALDNKEQTIGFVRKDDDWNDFVENEKFLKILESFEI